MQAKLMKKTMTVQPSGQISIGKRNAGKQIEVVEVGPGQWTITEVVTIPAHHVTFYTPQAMADMDAANEWIRTTRKAEVEEDADLDEFFQGIEEEESSSARSSRSTKGRRSAI